MAVRVPKGTEMTQEARLLIGGKSLPDILQGRTQAVDDGLPRRAVVLGHLASDAERGREHGHAFGARQPDLLRHHTFRRMRPRQLSAPRDDERLALKAVAPRA